ncbi:outer membrane homotrimeric porin [uncultured Mailhella sp.]|uniref:outer membrane homotrimeric porin n=1 Tax=uncultured Mailhella sp. TaxID=1981031 RepID=UPI003207DD18
MKKLITLVLAAGLVTAATSPASAVDLKMDGEYLFQFQSGSEGFHGRNTDYAVQRLRLGMTLTASEQLSGYFQLQVGEHDWGSDTTGNNQGVFMRQAYIDWVVPGTEVTIRMGRHAFDLPAYASTSTMIADLVGDGIVASVPLGERYNVTGFWTRLAREANGRGEKSEVNAPKYDLFGLVGTAKFDGFTASPWAIYGTRGDFVNEEGVRYNPDIMTEQGNLSGSGRADMAIFGAGFEWKPFDPVTLALDAAYGRVEYSASPDQEGWYAVGKAAYAMSFGEPTLLGWYSSGDRKGRAMNSGQIPIIYGDFNGTSTYFNAAWGILGGHRSSFGGTWGVSAQLNGVSFLENLSHDFSVTYFAGTNSKHNGAYGDGYDYLTTEDSAVEFNMLSTYEIYKNLTTALELAYIVEDFDTSAAHGRSGSYKDDWRAALQFQYAF